MKKRILTNEQDAYLRDIAPGRSVQECTDLLNLEFVTSFTAAQIKNYKSRNKISSGMKPWQFAEHSKCKITTEEQDQWILEHYKGIGNASLVQMFNETFGTSLTAEQMKNYKARHKLNSGVTGYFKKGHIPANKGNKGCYAAGSKKTWFASGHQPSNTDPIGTEKILGDGYVWVKIDNQPKVSKSVNWKQKHRLLWEKANGPIPEGSRLLFADGNRENITLDNLILVTKAESLIMNQIGLIKENPELTKTGALVAKMLDTANKKLKKEEGRSCENSEDGYDKFTL